MAGTRRRYSDEYKQAAVNFVLEDSRPIVEVAKNIDVSPAVLGRWVQKQRNEQQADDEELNIEEVQELQRLRVENRELKLQLEFAKKVATWFAKDQQ